MTIVAAFGTTFGGDDSLGLVVAERLRHLGLRVLALEPAGLLGLFTGGERVVIVDALVGVGVPGEVLHVTGAGLRRVARRHRVSSHGIGLGEALDVAAALDEKSTQDVHLVGIAVLAPGPAAARLSDAAARGAVDRAVALVRDLAG